MGNLKQNVLFYLQNFLGFGQSADIDIVFDDADKRKSAEVKTEDGKKEKYLLYYDGETVSGKVCLNVDVLVHIDLNPKFLAFNHCLKMILQQELSDNSQNLSFGCLS